MGNIVSVYVDGLKVKNPDRPSGYNHEITHMPFTEKALKESATKLVRVTTSLPNYENGYGIGKWLMKTTERVLLLRLS